MSDLIPLPEVVRKADQLNTLLFALDKLSETLDTSEVSSLIGLALDLSGPVAVHLLKCDSEASNA